MKMRSQEVELEESRLVDIPGLVDGWQPDGICELTAIQSISKKFQVEPVLTIGLTLFTICRRKA